MRKTLVAALLVSVGLGSQAFGQHHKEGLLTFALNNQAQHHTASGVNFNGTVDEVKYNGFVTESYELIKSCPLANGKVTYKTETRTKVTAPTVITAITKALALSNLTDDNGSPYVIKFTSKAQLIVAGYDNQLKAPPYPPNMELYNGAVLFNAPRFPDYTLVEDNCNNSGQLDWPAEYANAWGYMGVGPTWYGAKVFIKDPTNTRVALQCFDVTPFFSFEEAACKFCWDTMDRITDGSITLGDVTQTGLPCSESPNVDCSLKGSGTTKFYLTLKFNNTRGSRQNSKLEAYYLTMFPDLIFDGNTLGVFMSEAEASSSMNALVFTVGGIVTYKWSYKSLGKDEPVAPIGTMSMSTAQGYGQSPFCGVFWGSVSIAESSQADKGLCYEGFIPSWE